MGGCNPLCILLCFLQIKPLLSFWRDFIDPIITSPEIDFSEPLMSSLLSSFGFHQFITTRGARIIQHTPSVNLVIGCNFRSMALVIDLVAPILLYPIQRCHPISVFPTGCPSFLRLICLTKDSNALFVRDFVTPSAIIRALLCRRLLSVHLELPVEASGYECLHVLTSSGTWRFIP